MMLEIVVALVSTKSAVLIVLAMVKWLLKFVILWLEMVSAMMRPIMHIVNLMVETVVMMSTQINALIAVVTSERLVRLDFIHSQLEMANVMMKTTLKSVCLMDSIVGKVWFDSYSTKN